MGNSRTFRRRLPASREARKGLAMTSAPSQATMRRWLRAAEAEGLVRRAGDERTGRPGRPAHTWELTGEGREQARRMPPLEVMLEQVRRRENRKP